MPQAQQPWPAGVKILDEGLSAEKQKLDTAPPAAPKPPVRFAPGIDNPLFDDTKPGPVLSFMNSATAPFSMFNEQGSAQVPPIVSNAWDVLKAMTFNSPNMGNREEVMGGPGREVSGMARSVKGTAGKIVKGDANKKAEGLGQIAAQILQAWLLGKGTSMMLPEGGMPRTAEWQGPHAPQGPPTPPGPWQGPVKPGPWQGPLHPNEWQGPIQPQGPVQPPPEFQGPMPEPQGPQVPTARMMMGPKPQPPKPPAFNKADYYGPRSQPFDRATEFQGPHAPQGPQMPKYVVIRGLDPKNPGRFGRVLSSDVDPDILRQHLNSKVALEADALKSAQAPKPPTKSTAKPRGKK